VVKGDKMTKLVMCLLAALALSGCVVVPPGSHRHAWVVYP
jgi:hypothetical protein